MGGAAGFAGVHKAVECADILAMASPTLQSLPPPAHRDNHDPSPHSNRRPRLPISWRAGYRPAVMERWPNRGKLMKTAKNRDMSRPCLGWPKVALSAPFSGAAPVRPHQALP
jgi:hypothetical protein